MYFSHLCFSMVQVSKWVLFESAEVKLERRLKKNSIYPFQILCNDNCGNPIYVHSRRMPFFYFSLIGCVASVLCIIIWLLAGGDQEFLVFGVLVFVVSSYLCVEHRRVWSVVLEPSNAQYSIYVDRELVTTKESHNIYLRLQQKRTGVNSMMATSAALPSLILLNNCSYRGFRQTKYYLAINGWGFESSIVISGLTVNRTRLRLLAHRITKELKLNYFDLNDVSKLHIIRHDPAQPKLYKVSSQDRKKERQDSISERWSQQLMT